MKLELFKQYVYPFSKNRRKLTVSKNLLTWNFINRIGCSQQFEAIDFLQNFHIFFFNRTKFSKLWQNRASQLIGRLCTVSNEYTKTTFSSIASVTAFINFDASKRILSRNGRFFIEVGRNFQRL